MSGLPEGWEVAELGAFCSKIVDGSHNPPKAVDKGFPMLSARNIQGRKINFEDFRYISPEDFEQENSRTQIQANDVLLTIVGTIGRTAVVDESYPKFSLQRSVAVLRTSAVSPDYLSYMLESPLIQKFFTDNAKGTAQKGIYLKALSKVEIPIAPLAEQKRIADKLDALLARVDAARQRLDRMPQILKQFRQSVLAAATSGRLTEEWREEQALQDSLALHQVESREREKSGRLKLRGKQSHFELDEVLDLPKSWAWIENFRLAQDDANAICAGPFGTIFKAKDFRDDGVPIVFLRHVGEGKYLTHKPGFMDAQVWAELHQPYSIYGGELLVTKLGDPPGTACIFPVGVGHAMVTPDVMKMSVDEKVAEVRYLMYYFNSPNSKKIAADVSFGVTRLRIDLSLFKQFPIPLPPIEEQKEIVRRVESLFAWADRLETRYHTARARLDQLTPALLAKAFRGQLVPPNPEDEPAAALLERERVRATHTDAKPVKKQRTAPATCVPDAHR